MKRVWKSVLAIFAAMLMILCVACGNGKPETPGGDVNPPVVVEPETPGNEGFVPRQKQEMPTARIVDADYDYGDEAAWAGSEYASVDLGSVYLQDVISDTVYDWGHSVIKEGDTYKMWWVRPAVYDAIFYAESKDLKNWTDVQRVISLSPNATNITSYNAIKGMLGKPSVVHVGDTYYMYFEAPATEDPSTSATVKEWDNQVMLATSPDGINWNFYCAEGNEPTPVVSMPASLMGDTNNRHYGAGQPSVFYKDDTFYLTYCYVLYGSAPETGIWLATSSDGIHFGERSTHTRVSDKNGLGFTYNTLTGKYMRCSETRISESDTPDFTDQPANTSGNVYYSFEASQTVASFAEFVRNPHGLVDTMTFYIIHMQGVKSATSDWRTENATWDGHIHAVNPAEYANRTVTLPNGGAATENNLKEYRDRTNVYTRPDADAVYASTEEIAVDGVKESIYDGATKITVARSVYNYGSNFTDSWAEAWVAWNEEYLFVYAQVYDKLIDNSYPISSVATSYMHDSLDIFVDPANDHTTENEPWGLEQYAICNGSDNSDFIIKGSNDYDLKDEDFVKKTRHRVTLTDYGYAVEVRVPWNEFVVDYIEENAVIGMDFQVNDAMGGGVGREAIVCWSDYTANAFRFVDVMGDVRLVKA